MAFCDQPPGAPPHSVYVLRRFFALVSWLGVLTTSLGLENDTRLLVILEESWGRPRGASKDDEGSSWMPVLL